MSKKVLFSLFILLLTISQCYSESEVQITLPSDSDNIDFLSSFKISFEYSTTSKTENRKDDFIGVYDDTDQLVTVSPIHNKGDQSKGDITLKAGKSGTLKIKLIRPPGVVLAQSSIFVLRGCLNQCSNRGQCIKGQCSCDTGYIGTSCDGLMPDVSLNIDHNIKGQVSVQIKSTSVVGKVKMNGIDFIGIYDKTGSQRVPLVWKTVPEGSDSVLLLVPFKSGNFIAKLIKRPDLSVIAQSQSFQYFSDCPNECNNRGSCVNGTCVCNEGFDLDDCSRGLNIVNFTLSPSLMDSYYEGDFISVRWWRYEWTDNIFTNRDWIGLFKVSNDSIQKQIDYCQNPLQRHFAISTDCSDKDKKEKQGNWTTGLTNFHVKEKGDYIIKYVRTDNRVFLASNTIQVFPPCPYNNCSNRGICKKGKCQCEEGWTHFDCSQGDHPTSVTFSNINKPGISAKSPIRIDFERSIGVGTPTDYIGLFLIPENITNNENIGSIGVEVNMKDIVVWKYISQSERGMKDFSKKENFNIDYMFLTPEVSGKMVAKYIDGKTRKVIAQTTEFKIYESCENNCFSKEGHGSCSFGKCECSNGWTGTNCYFTTELVRISIPSFNLFKVSFISKINSDLPVSLSYPTEFVQIGDFVSLYRIQTNTSITNNSSETKENTFISFKALNYTSSRATSQNLTISVDRRVAIPGVYELRYYRGSTINLATSRPFVIVPDCGMGRYNFTLQKCKCPNYKSGEYCQVDVCCFTLHASTYRGSYNERFYVEWSRPNLNGSNGDYIGLYKKTDPVNAVPFQWQYAFSEKYIETLPLLAQQQYKIPQHQQQQQQQQQQLNTHSLLPSDQQLITPLSDNKGVANFYFPPISTLFELRYMNALNGKVMQTSDILECSQPCENPCPVNGICVSSICVCLDGFFGDDCSQQIPPIISLNATFIHMNETKFDFVGMIEISWHVPTISSLSQISSNDVIRVYNTLNLFDAIATVEPNPSPSFSETTSGFVHIGIHSKGSYQIRWESLNGHVLASTEIDIFFQRV